MQGRVIRAWLGATTVGLLALATAALASPVEAATSLGNWTPAAGSYTIDTTTLQLTGPGTSYTGTNEAGAATFTFGVVDIPAGATVTVSGSLPLEIMAQDSFTLAGSLLGTGGSATDFTTVAGGSPGGPGGGNGGPGGANPGSGPGGGGVASDIYNGAGGGGFGGAGAAGGVMNSDPGTAGTGGASYGDDPLTQLQGGSGGGGSVDGSGDGPADGGGGGGAIGIEVATGTLDLVSGSSISVDGGGGAVSYQGLLAAVVEAEFSWRRTQSPTVAASPPMAATEGVAVAAAEAGPAAAAGSP